MYSNLQTALNTDNPPSPQLVENAASSLSANKVGIKSPNKKAEKMNNLEIVGNCLGQF